MNTTPREISKLLSLSDTALYTVGDVMFANISAAFATTEGACRQSLLTYLPGLLFVLPLLLILMTSYCIKRCVFYCHLSWVCEHSQNTCWCQFRILWARVFPSLKPQTVIKFHLHLRCLCVCEWLVSHVLPWHGVFSVVDSTCQESGWGC